MLENLLTDRSEIDSSLSLACSCWASYALQSSGVESIRIVSKISVLSEMQKGNAVDVRADNNIWMWISQDAWP